MENFMLIFAVVGTLAIFATTRAGREVLKRIGRRNRVPDAAPSEDIAYLLSACDGDRKEVDRRIELERERLPDLTEAEHYRRAIRKIMSERSRAEKAVPESASPDRAKAEEA